MADVYQCELPEEVQKYCADVLNETEESRQKAFTEMKKWTQDNPHLHIRNEEKHFLPFLRSCKFDIERTKEKMKNFYMMRRDIKEWFTNRDPYLPEIQEMLKIGSYTALRKLNQNRLVIIIRPTIHDPKFQSVDNMMKSAQMIMDVATMENELMQIYGVTAIIDMANMSFSHITELSVSRLRHMAHSWEYYHCSPKQIEFVNAPIYVNVLLSVLKTFISKKMRGRLHAHYGGQTALTDIIDKDVLPKDYGGEGDTMEELGKYWIEKLKSYFDWFADDEKYKAE